MSLAIRFGDDENVDTPQGIVYFDAVTKYGSAYKGSLTSHAIGSGGKVSDHFIRDNPTYSFTGVVSAADISISKVFLKDENGYYPDNVSQIDLPPVRIKDNGNNLISLLPDAISSFFVDAIPTVQVDPTPRRFTLRQIKSSLETLFAKDGITFVTLLEYRGKVLEKDGITPNLVMTSLSFNEDSESGDALYVDITLELPTITALATTQLSKSDLKKFNADKVAAEVASAAADKKDKGDAPTTPDEGSDKKTSALRALLEQQEKTKAATKATTDLSESLPD